MTSTTSTAGIVVQNTPPTQSLVVHTGTLGGRTARVGRVILRKGAAPNFQYYLEKEGARVTSAATLDYIKSLVIPPKYTDVRIYVGSKDGDPCAPIKLTYTGIDEKGRTQYGYSATWKARAAKSKFRGLIEFGGILPKIRLAVANILRDKSASIKPTLSVNIALIVRIVNICHFRLGNVKYKDLYKSYGVSTIEARHLKFGELRGRPVAKISFIGKKGVKNNCVIDAPDVIAHLANLARGKGPREPIFATAGKPVRATDVNEWMRQFGADITSKMFRTYATNVMLIEQLAVMAAPTKAAPDGTPPASLTPTERKKNVNAALDAISGTIHNTRTVCKKEYTHPDLIEMYLNHPRRFQARFPPGVDAEPAFLAFLRQGA